MTRIWKSDALLISHLEHLTKWAERRLMTRTRFGEAVKIHNEASHTYEVALAKHRVLSIDSACYEDSDYEEFLAAKAVMAEADKVFDAALRIKEYILMEKS
jgi:hypothetical protein